jgi:Na+/H+ antiporter NhaD/arsenite permease-like protein
MGFRVKKTDFNQNTVFQKNHLRNLAWICLIMVGIMALTPQSVVQASETAMEKSIGSAAGHASGEQKTNVKRSRYDVQEELGKLLPYWTVVPFVVILLGIALIPLTNGHWWESNLNKSVISTLCSLPVLGYLIWMGPLGIEVLAAILRDYYAFIVLLVALYTISGGIHLEGNLKASPLVNSAFLCLGALIASFIGTTGATMLLIRPLLHTHQERKYKNHIFIFFIFIVANIGGSLLPVGDPPLFLGYLFGVPFLWTLCLWKIWLTEVALLLIIFYFWDTRAYSKESQADIRWDIKGQSKLKIHGLVNIILFLGVLFLIIFLKDYQMDQFTLKLAWMQQPAMILLALVSFVLDQRKKEREHKHGHLQFKSPRENNAFTFYPMIEVAVLFLGIFITMTPAICLLKAHGAETGLRHAWQFFWMSGILSSFLDNAPTYAAYFALGQGVTKGLLSSDPGLSVVATATGSISEQILMSISVGSVFMGASSYIGNAPNFIVKSICEEAKVKMPSFFGYMIYSGAILIPSFFIIMFMYLM